MHSHPIYLTLVLFTLIPFQLTSYTGHTAANTPLDVVVLSYGASEKEDSIYAEIEGEKEANIPGLRKLLTNLKLRFQIYNDLAVKDIPKTLRQIGAGSHTLIIVVAHGEDPLGDKRDEASKKTRTKTEVAKERTSFRIGSDFSVHKFFKLSTFIQSIESFNKKARVWLKTCFSGNCLESTTLCLGTACSANEACNLVTANALYEILKLEADSKHGSCDLWHRFDNDHNGTISARELTIVFRRDKGYKEQIYRLEEDKQQSDLEQVDTEYYLPDRTLSLEEQIRVTKQRLSRKFKEAAFWLNTGRDYRVFCSQQGRRMPPTDVFATSKDTAIAKFKKESPQAEDCTAKQGNRVAFLTVRWHDNACYSSEKPDPLDIQHPEFRTFHITSTRCLKKWADIRAKEEANKDNPYCEIRSSKIKSWTTRRGVERHDMLIVLTLKKQRNEVVEITINRENDVGGERISQSTIDKEGSLTHRWKNVELPQRIRIDLRYKDQTVRSCRASL